MPLPLSHQAAVCRARRPQTCTFPRFLGGAGMRALGLRGLRGPLGRSRLVLLLLLGLQSLFRLWLLVVVGLGRLGRLLRWVPLGTSPLVVVARGVIGLGSSGVAAVGVGPLV